MSSYTQVPQRDSQLDPGDPQDGQPPPPAGDSARALFRIYYLTATLCCGGLLFGYDSGVIGGVLTFNPFLTTFNIPPSQTTTVSSIAVGIQQAGALAGSLAISPLTTRLGRRAAMKFSSAIFCLGVILEIVDSHSLPVFYAGRIIAGLGVGGSATVIPIYLAEMSPARMRARLGSCYQFSFTVGILVSYWVDYGVLFWRETEAQWRVPLALQIVPGLMMGLGMLGLHESVRWLLVKGDIPAAWRSLVWIRADDGPAVEAEFASMKRAIRADRHATADFRLRELLAWRNARRLALGVGLFLAQQSTGATAMAYFGPQFFGLLVGAENKALTLLLTGVFGGLKVVSCAVFIVWVAERFGRRPLLVVGAVGMAGCMIATAVVVKAHPPDSTTSTSTSIKPASLATILLIYLTIVIYNLSWGPLPWPCTTELFPTRIREPGVAVAVAAQWASNFAWSFSTPYVLAGLGWATFLLFGVLDLGIAGFVAACLPETGGKSLEEIEGEGMDEQDRGEEEPLNRKGSDGR